MQLAKLVSNGGNRLSIGVLALHLQIAQRFVDAVDLPMGPALHTVPPAEALERGHRNIHRLLLEFVVDGDGAVHGTCQGRGGRFVLGLTIICYAPQHQRG